MNLNFWWGGLLGLVLGVNYLPGMVKRIRKTYEVFKIRRGTRQHRFLQEVHDDLLVLRGSREGVGICHLNRCDLDGRPHIYMSFWVGGLEIVADDWDVEGVPTYWANENETVLILTPNGYLHTKVNDQPGSRLIPLTPYRAWDAKWMALVIARWVDREEEGARLNSPLRAQPLTSRTEVRVERQPEPESQPEVQTQEVNRLFDTLNRDT